jgi:hypothetical protein
MTRTRAILALLCAATALQGCDLLDILQHKPTKAQRDHEAALARQSISLPQDRTPDFTDLYNLSPAPITTDPPVPVAQVTPEPAPVDPGPPPFVCETIWRIQTCDEGVLYALDSSGNWILPGRTQ